MKFKLVSGLDSVDIFIQIAELDRHVWTDSDDAQYVPDGEHSWRVWTEYSFVCAAIAPDGTVAGAICAFDTKQPTLHFFHKLFIDARFRRMGVGSQLLAAYCEYLDEIEKSSSMTTSPTNTAMIGLSDTYGFLTESNIRGYYRPSEDRLLRTRLPQAG
jgi:ribosomal protein S18 acetylase RimI-like enzyme